MSINLGPVSYTHLDVYKRQVVRSQPHFAEVVRRAFSQRRKTLRNALSGLLDARQIEAAGVDAGARAETLDLAAFAALGNAVFAPVEPTP